MGLFYIRKYNFKICFVYIRKRNFIIYHFFTLIGPFSVRKYKFIIYNVSFIYYYLMGLFYIRKYNFIIYVIYVHQET